LTDLRVEYAAAGIPGPMTKFTKLTQPDLERKIFPGIARSIPRMIRKRFPDAPQHAARVCGRSQVRRQRSSVGDPVA
jgi:hypothetical protein